MVGSLFVGIAYQPFIFMMLSLQIGLDTYLTRKRRETARRQLSPLGPLRPAQGGV